MIISHIKLKNWRNFRSVDVALQDQVFLVGPNACGKSNFLDALRFLRDLAKPGGSLQKAVNERGGIPKIRSLSTRLMIPHQQGTEVKLPCDDQEIQLLLESGLSIGEAVLPETTPPAIAQLELFK